MLSTPFTFCSLGCFPPLALWQAGLIFVVGIVAMFPFVFSFLFSEPCLAHSQRLDFERGCGKMFHNFSSFGLSDRGIDGVNGRR